MQKYVAKTFKIDHFGSIGSEVLDFGDEFRLARSWSQKSKESEKEKRGDDRHQTQLAEPRPRRGEGGGEVNLPLGSEG